jgi:dynamin 1-like protein
MTKTDKENNARKTPAKYSIGAGVPQTPLSMSSATNNSFSDAKEEAMEENQQGIMDFIFRGSKSPQPRMMDHENGPPSVVHLPQVPLQMRHGDLPPSERERVEMEVIKSLIVSYFGIVQKNFIDMVPKTIMYFLVNHVRSELQNELVSELYREAEVGQLMQEAEDIADRRKSCEEMKDLLSKAFEIVNEVRDFNTFNK